ncbi:MAG: N-acetyltransferase family protein [Novosphingobium sp.]
MPAAFAIALATQADAPAMAAIYGKHVLSGVASFETAPPDEAEVLARMAKVGQTGLPWLTARGPDGEVLGFAYAGPYHARPAYRFTCEDSIYIRDDMRGRGIGKALLAALIEACEQAGMRQMVALIAGTETPSVVLHERAGFRHCGRLQSVGRKFGQWLDVIHMQRALGPGDGAAPSEEPQ